MRNTIWSQLENIVAWHDGMAWWWWRIPTTMAAMAPWPNPHHFLACRLRPSQNLSENKTPNGCSNGSLKILVAILPGWCHITINEVCWMMRGTRCHKLSHRNASQVVKLKRSPFNFIADYPAGVVINWNEWTFWHVPRFNSQYGNLEVAHIHLAWIVLRSVLFHVLTYQECDTSGLIISYLPHKELLRKPHKKRSYLEDTKTCKTCCFGKYI